MNGLMIEPPRVIDADPDVEILALADLGQKVVNAVQVSLVLGHTNMRHSTRYMHGQSSAVRLIMAVIDGEIDAASEALEAWRVEAPDEARAVMEGVARQTVDPYAPSARSRSGARTR